MNLIDPSIEARGFARQSVALAIRTIGACTGMRQHARDRLLIGIGLVLVDPDGPSYRFSAFARCMVEGDTEADLLDWLQYQLLTDRRAIISFDNWGSVPRRIAALADPVRHESLISLTRATSARWRDLPRGHTWHLRQASAQAMPCLCPPGVQMADCTSTPEMSLLPLPEITGALLVEEAVAGWRCWAQTFCDFADAQKPAQAALHALDQWQHA